MFLDEENKKEKKTEKDNDGIKESNISEKETDNNKKIIKEEENYNNIMMNIEKEEQIKQGKYEDLYTIEQYFLHKNNCNSDEDEDNYFSNDYYDKIPESIERIYGLKGEKSEKKVEQLIEMKELNKNGKEIKK